MTLKVSFEPNFNPNRTGTASSISWFTLKPFLEKAFNVSDSELISGLTIDENGITAHFDKKLKVLSKAFIIKNFAALVDHQYSTSLNVSCDFCFRRSNSTLNGFECCNDHLASLHSFILKNS